MRVAFSVATAFRPDLLIVDEALSVGDSYFQHKSFARIRKFRDQGVSIMLVTHSAGDIKALCDRALLLDGGHVVHDGPPDEVVEHYSALVADKENRKLTVEQRRTKDGWVHSEFGTRDAFVESMRLVDATTGEDVSLASVGQRLVIDTSVVIDHDLPRLVLGHHINDRTGHLVWGSNTWHTRQMLNDLRAGERIRFRARIPCNLGPGSYAISFGLVSSDTHLENSYHLSSNHIVFDVVNSSLPYFMGTSWLDTQFEIERSLP